MPILLLLSLTSSFITVSTKKSLTYCFWVASSVEIDGFVLQRDWIDHYDVVSPFIFANIVAPVDSDDAFIVPISSR